MNWWFVAIWFAIDFATLAMSLKDIKQDRGLDIVFRDTALCLTTSVVIHLLLAK